MLTDDSLTVIDLTSPSLIIDSAESNFDIVPAILSLPD